MEGNIFCLENLRRISVLTRIEICLKPWILLVPHLPRKIILYQRQNVNNNSGRKPAEGETSSTSSANRISLANSTPAPKSGGEVSEFHSVEDISISRTNSQIDTREDNSNTETTICNNMAIQTDFPQIIVPFLQRNKWEREYATAKPNKFRKIDSYFKNTSSIELNQQKNFEDSFLNLSINDHERNINSQDVRAVAGQDLLEWPDIGLALSRSQDVIHSTPVRIQNNSGSQNYRIKTMAK